MALFFLRESYFQDESYVLQRASAERKFSIPKTYDFVLHGEQSLDDDGDDTMTVMMMVVVMMMMSRVCRLGIVIRGFPRVGATLQARSADVAYADSGFSTPPTTNTLPAKHQHPPLNRAARQQGTEEERVQIQINQSTGSTATMSSTRPAWEPILSTQAPQIPCFGTCDRGFGVAGNTVGLLTFLRPQPQNCCPIMTDRDCGSWCLVCGRLGWAGPW